MKVALAAEEVGDPAAEQQQAAEGERVGGDDPLPVVVGEAERLLGGGQRDVHDGRVEHDHQLGDAEDGEDRPAAVVVGVRVARGHGVLGDRKAEGTSQLRRRQASNEVEHRLSVCGTITRDMAPETQTPEVVAPLRKDAERNRRRILEAAGQVFAERGLEVTLDEIARHAGVGVGTVYRRFPDKEELIEALFDRAPRAAVAAADRALATPDSWEGLVGFLDDAFELQAADRGLKELVVQRVARARPRHRGAGPTQAADRRARRARPGRRAGCAPTCAPRICAAAGHGRVDPRRDARRAPRPLAPVPGARRRRAAGPAGRARPASRHGARRRRGRAAPCARPPGGVCLRPGRGSLGAAPLEGPGPPGYEGGPEGRRDCIQQATPRTTGRPRLLRLPGDSQSDSDSRAGSPRSDRDWNRSGLLATVSPVPDVLNADALAVTLRDAGRRVTAPRLAVYAAVAAHGHLDADGVGRVVRGELGSVSTQTVYDALAVLCDLELLRRIEPARRPRAATRRAWRQPPPPRLPPVRRRATSTAPSAPRPAWTRARRRLRRRRGRGHVLGPVPRLPTHDRRSRTPA